VVSLKDAQRLPPSQRLRDLCRTILAENPTKNLLLEGLKSAFLLQFPFTSQAYKDREKVSEPVRRMLVTTVRVSSASGRGGPVKRRSLHP
jgi:hypothetical protein